VVSVKGGYPKILIFDLMIFCKCLTPKNDVRTKIKSNKQIIFSENDIEKF